MAPSSWSTCKLNNFDTNFECYTPFDWIRYAESNGTNVKVIHRSVIEFHKSALRRRKWLNRYNFKFDNFCISLTDQDTPSPKLEKSNSYIKPFLRYSNLKIYAHLTCFGPHNVRIRLHFGWKKRHILYIVCLYVIMCVSIHGIIRNRFSKCFGL